MPKSEISKVFLSEIKKVATARGAGDMDALLNVDGLPDEEQEAALLLNQALESYKSDDAIIAHKKEAETTQGVLENMLHGLDVGVCVTVPQTGEILFLNDKLRGLFGVDVEPTGQFCYKLLMGLDERCESCPYHQLEAEPDKTVVWEHRETTGNTVRKTARLIDWLGGVKAHLVYGIDVSDVSDHIREQARLESILDAVDSYIYVSDLETDELLFINKRMAVDFHFDKSSKLGKCWKQFRPGAKKRCDLCKKPLLLANPGEPLAWEEYNPIIRKTLYHIDQVIEWTDGRMVHIQQGIDITEVREARVALERRSKILDIMNKAALILLRQEKKSFASAMNESFGLIADIAGIDRMSVFRNSEKHEDGLHLSQIYRWRKDAGGTVSTLENLMDTTYAALVPRWEKILATGELICGLTRLMPEADALAQFGCVSVLVIPVFNDGLFWGYVIYERLVEEEFTDFEIDVLRSASFMLANAVIRNEEAALIQDAEERTKVMLRTQAHWYKSILDATPLPISVTDADGNWTFTNKAVEEFLKVKNEDMIGKPCSHWNTHICKTNNCGIACAKRGITQTFFKQDDSSYQVDVGILRDLSGEAMGFVEVVQNITEVKHMARRQVEMERSISHLESEAEKIHYDPLTSIYSRRYFEENIEPMISTLSRATGILSLMMVDIDCFKQLNDTLGHMEGDECLRIVAEVLQSCTMRKDDYVARYGGEEFVVVLPNTDEAGARKIAGKMLSGIWERNILHPQSTAADRVTISIGIVSGRVKHTNKRDDFLKRADEMLYQSKQAGRNQYTYTDL